MSLTETILADLKTRVAAGAALPEPTTLAGLAAHFGASLTPVRAAVAALLTEGWLVRDDGRLAANASRRGTTTGVVAAARADEAAELTDLVVRASLRGEAIFLREESTGERLGVSRTVVRGVFAKLVGSGLLEHVPRRGWRVVPWSEKDTDDYLAVRETLELRALDLAWDRIDGGEIERMLAGNEPGDGGERLDNRLHGYFIETADNRYIREFFRTQGAYYTALFDFAAPAAEVVAEMASQHREILAKVLARDRRAASSALAGHIRAQKPILLRLAAAADDSGKTTARP